VPAALPEERPVRRDEPLRHRDAQLLPQLDVRHLPRRLRPVQLLERRVEALRRRARRRPVPCRRPRRRAVVPPQLRQHGGPGRPQVAGLVLPDLAAVPPEPVVADELPQCRGLPHLLHHVVEVVHQEDVLQPGVVVQPGLVVDVPQQQREQLADAARGRRRGGGGVVVCGGCVVEAGVAEDRVQGAAAVGEEAAVVEDVAGHGVDLPAVDGLPRRLAVDGVAELLDGVAHGGAQLLDGARDLRREELARVVGGEERLQLRPHVGERLVHAERAVQLLGCARRHGDRVREGEQLQDASPGDVGEALVAEVLVRREDLVAEAALVREEGPDHGPHGVAPPPHPLVERRPLHPEHLLDGDGLDAEERHRLRERVAARGHVHLRELWPVPGAQHADRDGAHGGRGSRGERDVVARGRVGRRVAAEVVRRQRQAPQGGRRGREQGARLLLQARHGGVHGGGGAGRATGRGDGVVDGVEVVRDHAARRRRRGGVPPEDDLLRGGDLLF